MRIPSRRMPGYSRAPMPFWAKAILAACALGLLIAICGAPASYTAAATGALALIWLIADRAARKGEAHRYRIASSREDSICTFARSFDFRRIDTWVIRGVYEELQGLLARDGRPFPIRAQDELVRDLRIDPEDIDMSLAPAIAQRTGRNLEKSERNPYFGKVHSVADLVMFFEHQPNTSSNSFKPNPRRGSA